MRRVLFRILLVAGALAYMAVLGRNVLGAWCLDHPTPDNLSRGLRWNAENPLLWTQYGGYWLYASGGSESQRAVDAFTRAAIMNPMDPANWNGLATAYLQMLETPKAAAALQSLLTALPHSPQGTWREGNFLLLQGEPKKAFPYLKAAAGAERALHRPLFDLAWKILPDSEAILRELVPADPVSHEDYFRFLLERQKVAEAKETWREIRSHHTKEALNLGYAYLDVLARFGMGDEAAKVWEGLLADTGRTSAKPAGELLTNGDFEAGLPNVGLDWRVVPGTGYDIELDDSVMQSGDHSLRVAFDGSTNVESCGLQQLVPVEPNRDYRFQAYMKTDNITTNKGVLFRLINIGARGEDRGFVDSAEKVGTNPWMLEQVNFRTEPDTRFVRVALCRFRSVKLDNLIEGKAWVDSVSLRPRP